MTSSPKDDLVILVVLPDQVRARLARELEIELIRQIGRILEESFENGESSIMIFDVGEEELKGRRPMMTSAARGLPIAAIAAAHAGGRRTRGELQNS